MFTEYIKNGGLEIFRNLHEFFFIFQSEIFHHASLTAIRCMRHYATQHRITENTDN